MTTHTPSLLDNRGGQLSVSSLLAQVSKGSVYLMGLQKGTYTITAGSWAIAYTGFTGLTVNNFPYGIINLTTGQIYTTINVVLSTTAITLDSSMNAGYTTPAANDILLIPVVQDERAYDTTLDSTKVLEQSPPDQQTLNETLLSAVVATGVSGDVYVLDKKQITICIVASAVTTGCTFLVQGTPDNTNYGNLGVISNTGSINTTITISTNGTFFYEVANASSVPYIRANINARTDGTYTCYMFARA